MSDGPSSFGDSIVALIGVFFGLCEIGMMLLVLIPSTWKEAAASDNDVIIILGLIGWLGVIAIIILSIRSRRRKAIKEKQAVREEIPEGTRKFYEEEMRRLMQPSLKLPEPKPEP